MSTIKVSAIQDLSGGQNVNVPNAAKAWIYWNPSTNVINASFGVSSITDVNTNRDIINFTAAFADANYAVVGTAQANATGINNGRMLCPFNYSASSIEVVCQQAYNSANSAVIANVAVFK